MQPIRSPSTSLTRSIARFAAAAVLLLTAACDNKVSPAAYAKWTNSLVEEGLMRTDIEAIDVPYTDAELAEHFRRIALYHETDAGTAGGPSNRSSQPIHKWGGPVRYALMGDGVTERDLQILDEFEARVAAATGLDIGRSMRDVNLFITITTTEERAIFSEAMGNSGLAPLRESFDRWRRDPNWICGGNALISAERPHEIVAGLIFLDAGVSGRLREACLHEEFAQILGLFNDDPSVRPSLFTDTSEFARMTVHDAELLSILYDPRLTPGMSEDEAMELVPEIIEDMRRSGMRAGTGL